MPLSVSLPAQEAETPGRAVLVRLRPEALRLLQASFEYLTDRHTRAIVRPSTDHFFPRVPFVALGLLIRRHPYPVRGVKPPDTTGVKPGFRFRPQLVAVTGQLIDVDCATGDWPKSTAAGLIPKVRAVIHRAGENTLARRLDQPHAIRRLEAVGCPAHEGP